MSIYILDSITQLARPSLPTVSFYVFIFVGLVFIYLKLSQPTRLSQIANNMRIEENKFDLASGLMNQSISSLLMQISYILLQTTGIWTVTSSEYDFSSFLLILLFVTGIYLVQLLGFYFFSSITTQENKSFFRHRITHYEFFTLIYLPIFIALTFIPYDYNLIMIVIIGACSLFSLVRSAIYLTPYISVFNNILYLCTLELLPALFLIKLVLTK